MNKVLSSSPDCEIISTRIFNVSREEMYSAWTNPEILQKWWGPTGFTNTFHTFELREGGKWIFTMHGPEGGNYENESVFVAIKAPELLVWDHISPPEFQIVTSFEEVTARETRVIFKMVFDSPKACDKLKNFVPEKNEENFDRLENVLKTGDV